jgi:hypothetical protein
VHEVVKRRLSETPPVKAYVFILATPDPSADMLAAIGISVITVMVAVNDS